MERNSTYKETFFIVPRHILEISGVLFSYIKVYETIFQFWNKGLNCFLCQKSLMERTGLSKKQIYEALDFFEKNNELTRVYVGGKRYLTRPEKKIETDIQGSPTGDSGVTHRLPKESPTGDHNIKKVNKENNISKKERAAPRKTKIKKSTPIALEQKDSLIESHPPMLSERTQMAEYRETLFPMPTTKQALSMQSMAQDNPHQVPIEMIEDWLSVRKAKRNPVTPTAWKRLNQQLAKCDDPIEAFEIMVTHGWTSLNHSWIARMQKDNNPSKNIDWDKELNSTDWIHRV